MTHWYGWRNNPERARLYGQRCRVVVTGKMGSVLVQFASGERVVVSRRALRKAPS